MKNAFVMLPARLKEVGQAVNHLLIENKILRGACPERSRRDQDDKEV